MTLTTHSSDEHDNDNETPRSALLELELVGRDGENEEAYIGHEDDNDTMEFLCISEDTMTLEKMRGVQHNKNRNNNEAAAAREGLIKKRRNRACCSYLKCSILVVLYLILLGLFLVNREENGVHEEEENTLECGYLNKSTESGKSVDNPHATINAHKHIIVMEDYKLLFFTINKNGSTFWIILFRKMLGLPDSHGTGSLLHDHTNSGLKYLADYSQEKALEMLNSPEWTFAVFLRDPITRWLSAYLDKAILKPQAMADNCCPQLVRQEKFDTCDQCNQFLKESPEHGFDIMQGCWNAHWIPQSRFVTPDLQSKITFKGYMKNLETDGEALMRRIGVWDTFGATGYGPNGTDSIFHKKDTHDSVSGQHDATDAKDELVEMISPELKQELLEYYQEDYDNPYFNFTIPDF